VWGFGCVLYQLCAGRPLFSDVDSSDDNIYKPTTAKELIQWTDIDNERLSYVFEGHDKDADEARDLIRQCLRGDPSDRLQTMKEVIAHPFLGGKSKGTRGQGTTKKVEWNSTEVYPDGSYAVIIAIDKYENAGVPVDEGGFKNLDCTVKDAKLMRETLEARGFTILQELLNEEATKNNIEDCWTLQRKK
jgi:serine/threonine protein kinase